jgi:hypothetical protein
MKKSVFSLVLIMIAGLGSLSHAISIDPRSVHTVVEGKIYRAGVTKGGKFGTPLSDFTYPCTNGFTMVLNAYSNNDAKTVQCPDGRFIVYAGAHWQNAKKDDLAASELRRGGKVLVHCMYGVDASNEVAWIGAARAGLISPQQASDGFYHGQKGSLGDAKYRQMAASILQRGQ